MVRRSAIAALIEVKKSLSDLSGFKEELIYWSGGYEKLI
jgi:hypothetical protein